MEWIICFCLSLAVLVSAITISISLAKRRYRSDRVWNSFNVLFGGIFVSSTIIFFPIYGGIFAEHAVGAVKVFLLSLHNTLRLFIVDADFEIILEHTDTIQGGLSMAYSTLAAVLFVLAPALTFGVVLSFFKNIFSYVDYWLRYFTDIYIFSELNVKSLALAKSLKENNKKRVIVFTDVYENNEESISELIEEAHKLGVIMFRRDIIDINFGIHSNKKHITFFAIGESEVENNKQALRLIEKYKERENTSVYVFAINPENELLLSKVEKGRIKVRRINDVHSLVNRLLYDEGMKIFDSAVPYDDKEKLISAVVIGMGHHGTEMTKALSWFCQMDGYRVVINSFDLQTNAKSRFVCLCPELMDDNYNKDFTTNGEAHYSIDVHSGIDVELQEFWEKLKDLPRVTYAFVALGDDEKNIRTAIKLRSWFTKGGMNPQIDTVVWDTDKVNALDGITNHSGQAYNINFIGDLESSYSEKVILHSDVEKVALARHMRWGDAEEFWRYEYNYRSSIASAIHRKYKSLCGISGIDQEPEERKEEDRWNIRILEHRRWNAYMRSEGYTFAEKRNNLAKTHHCLVPFEQLTLAEQEKDDD